MSMAAGLVSMRGIDINTQGQAAHALSVEGNVGGTQLSISDCNVYADGTDYPLVVDVPMGGGGTPGVVYVNVNFNNTAPSGVAEAAHVLSGTVQGYDGTFTAGNGNNNISVYLGSSAQGHGRLWAKGTDLFGRIEAVQANAGNTAVLDVRNSQIRYGASAVGLVDNSNGAMTLVGVHFQGTTSGPVASTNNVPGDRPLTYGDLTFNTARQWMPAAATMVASSDAAAGSTYVVAKRGAPYTSVQSAIAAAAADGPTASNPGLVLVQPGTYTEDVVMAPFVHVKGVMDGRSFSTTLSGTVTVNFSTAEELASWDGVDISDGVVFTGTAKQQLFIRNATVYSNSGGTPLLLNAGNSSSRVEADNVFFRTTGASVSPAADVLNGTLEATRGGFRNNSGTDDGLAVRVQGTGSAYLGHTELFGQMSLSTSGTTSLGDSVIHSGLSVDAISASGAGAVIIDNVGFTTQKLTPVINDSGAGPVYYNQLSVFTSSQVPTGASFGLTLAAGDVYANSVLLTSDRNAKENFKPIDPRDVLRKVAALPVTTWNYKKEAQDVVHMGPTAQDFSEAFGLNGGVNTVISSIDEAGVAIAAIQGLHAELADKAAEIQALKQSVESDQARIARLEADVKELQAIAKANGFSISPTAGFGIGLGILGFAWMRRRNVRIGTANV